MAKKVLSIQTGIWWTKVALIDYGVKHPQVHDVFTFRTPDHAVEDGYIRERESLANQLRAELSKRKIAERRVVFSINSAKVVSREDMVPKVKEKQLKSLAHERAREIFPMDINGYTISYSKMGMLDGDPKQQMKLLLLAVPDNLLSNYVSFAELAGLEIETFEYMGNCAMQFVANNYIEDAVIVQLEERSTIVSVVKDNKLAFQRVAPHGYDSTLAAAIDHPVLGLREDLDAFEFLCKNNVTKDRIKPEMFSDSVIVDPQERAAAVQQAYDALKESMDYHVRIVVSALEFYQNQYKLPLRGTLHLIGDGMRIQGMARYFDTKINIEVEKGNYLSLVKMDKKATNSSLAEGESLGLLSVFGATINPMGIMPKELAARASKRNSTKAAALLFIGAALVSAGLVGYSYLRLSTAQREQKKLQDRIAELEPVQLIYDENTHYRALAEQYTTFDGMTKSHAEKTLMLIQDLEQKLPEMVVVESMSVSGDSVVVNMKCDETLTVAQLLINLKELNYLTNITIPSISRETKESPEGEEVVVGWRCSMSAKLIDPPSAFSTSAK